jgi:AraC-like DNA-binding protein
VEKAKVLLRTEGQSSLQYIAEKVGYDNVSRFIRNFRQYTGLTPGAYRSMIDR